MTTIEDGSTTTDTEAAVTWSFIRAEYERRRDDETTTTNDLRMVNARIRCWRMLYEADPVEGERVA